MLKVESSEVIGNKGDAAGTLQFMTVLSTHSFYFQWNVYMPNVLLLQRQL